MTDVVLMGDPRVAALPVEECGEDLVDARELAQLRVADHPDPRSEAYSFMRRSIAERLVRAQGLLPVGLHLLVVEAYRPYELQEYYFDQHRQRLAEARPALSDSEIFLAASRFVSPPDVAPHVSGAAIDLTITTADGRELDMGTPIDASPEESEGACYFAAENIGADARRNRELLASALTAAGLVNYPTEWWHWSYGDRYWALVRGRPGAIFGPVKIATGSPPRL